MVRTTSGASALDDDLPWLSDYAVLTGEAQTTYMDSAALTLMPHRVRQAITEFLDGHVASVHRGRYATAERATDEFESAREAVAGFLHARRHEIVFTKNCTEAINIVARGLGLDRDDEVLVTVLEHHSNYLPWLGVATVRQIGLTADGTVDLDELERSIGPRTRVIAITHASNVTGVIQPLRSVTDLAQKHGLLTVVDAAQSVSHLPIDVEGLGCDFLAFSGGKIFTPPGIGVLYGKADALRGLAPLIRGGGMVDRVGPSGVKFRPPPHGLEAGTPNTSGAAALRAAIDYVQTRGRTRIHERCTDLAKYLVAQLLAADVVDLPFSSHAARLPIAAFRIRRAGMSGARLATILADSYSIAVRDGHHCCQPLFDHFKLDDSVRASLHIYNTRSDVDRLVQALRDLRPLIA